MANPNLQTALTSAFLIATNYADHPGQEAATQALSDLIVDLYKLDVTGRKIVEEAVSDKVEIGQAVKAIRAVSKLYA
jgi:hypothetical protein